MSLGTYVKIKVEPTKGHLSNTYVDEAYARSCASGVWLRCLICKKSAEQDSRQASCMRRGVLGYPRSTVLYITVQYPKGGTESVPSPTGMVRDTAQREKSPGQLIAKNKHGQILHYKFHHRRAPTWICHHPSGENITIQSLELSLEVSKDQPLRVLSALGTPAAGACRAPSATTRR